MQQAFYKVAPTRQSWHSIGDAAGVRRVLRLWDILLMRRHLAELPDDGHVYEDLQEVLRRGGTAQRLRVVRSEHGAYELVTVCSSRLRELTESLEWLHEALVTDHENKYTQVDGRWVVLDDVDDPPCTEPMEAQLAAESIAAILEAAYERFVREDEWWPGSPPAPPHRSRSQPPNRLRSCITS